MSKRIELCGQTFGSWLVIRYQGINDLRQPSWYCECICGTKRIVVGQTLRSGRSSSCGCTKNEAIRKSKIIHGQSGIKGGVRKSREYSAWEAMKRRCATKQMNTWLYYGRWGVKVCKRWEKSFLHFLADMGKCPEGLTLDRINPYGDYKPSNCRWADWKTQANNKRPRG